MREKYEQKLYDAETLIEAFEVLKDMFETLMTEIMEAKPSPADKVDFADLELEGQTEKKNMEELIRKYQTEIRALTKTQQEATKLSVEITVKYENAMCQIDTLQNNLQVAVIANDRNLRLNRIS